MKKTIYISGPITAATDEQQALNLRAFFKAEAKLQKLGFVVLNPAVLPVGLPYKSYMQIDVAMLQVCDCIYMLIGHACSPGAKGELAIAKSIKLEEFYESEGDDALIRSMAGYFVESNKATSQDLSTEFVDK